MILPACFDIKVYTIAVAPHDDILRYLLHQRHCPMSVTLVSCSQAKNDLGGMVACSWHGADKVAMLTEGLTTHVEKSQHVLSPLTFLTCSWTKGCQVSC